LIGAQFSKILQMNSERVSMFVFSWPFCSFAIECMTPNGHANAGGGCGRSFRDEPQNLLCRAMAASANEI
jgi:hypothetical protein